MSQTKKQKRILEEHKNSLLCNYPVDVIAVVNGKPVRKSDVTEWHRGKQRRRINDILRDQRDKIVPCIVWTFYNDSFVYGGWWLYIVTHKNSWCIGTERERVMFEKIIQLFPLGILPLPEKFDEWMRCFAETFPISTAKRPKNQGMKIAWAKVSASGRLLNVALSKNAL